MTALAIFVVITAAVLYFFPYAGFAGGAVLIFTAGMHLAELKSGSEPKSRYRLKAEAAYRRQNERIEELSGRDLSPGLSKQVNRYIIIMSAVRIIIGTAMIAAGAAVLAKT